MTNRERDLDTFTRIDYAISRLESGHQMTQRERRDIALLLRRWRKERYGSALTDRERDEGRTEINP